MKHYRYSPHIIESEGNYSFDPADFSRFKVGSKAASERFGKDLAESFIEEFVVHNAIDLQKPFLAVPSPYGHLPKATSPLIKYFAQYYNVRASKNNLKSMQIGKITRYATHTVNYNIMSKEERTKLFENDNFTFDVAGFNQCTVIAVDDIKITGSAEKIIHNLFERVGLTTDVVRLNYIELANKDIEPNIEYKLNTRTMKSMQDIAEMIHEDGFCINTRIVKELLKSEPHVIAQFIDTIGMDYAREIYHGALGNDFHELEDLIVGFKYLEQLLMKN